MASSDVTALDNFNVACATFFAVSAVSTLARLYTRAGLFRSLGIDDCLIVLATIFGLVLFPLQIILNNHLKGSLAMASRSGGAPPPSGPPAADGGGRPANGTLPAAALKQAAHGAKLDYVSLLFYMTQFGMIKLSLLAFYYRFLPDKYRRPIFIVGTTIALYTIITCLASIFQCTPISDAFRPARDVHCPVNRRMLQTAMGFLNVVSDLIILLMPVSTVIRLHMALRKKVILLLIFSLGALGTVATCMRLSIMFKMARLSTSRSASAVTLTRYIGESTLWTQVEVSTATMCANFPALTSLWKAYTERKKPKPSYYGSSGKGYSLSKKRRGGSSGDGTDITAETTTAPSPRTSQVVLTDEHKAGIVRATEVNVHVDQV